MSVIDTYPEHENHMFPVSSQAYGDSHVGLPNFRSYSALQ